MLIDNGSQIQNYGIQLQNLGTQIQNFSISCLQIPQNIKNQIQNMVKQISDIAIQIFNIGTVLSTMVNQDINMMNQNMFMGMGMNFPNIINQNLFNEMEMNGLKPLGNDNINNSNAKSELKFVNFWFMNSNGSKTNVVSNSEVTIKELAKLYMNKVGLKYELFEENKIYFLINGNSTLGQNKEKKVKDLFTNLGQTNTIDVLT